MGKSFAILPRPRGDFAGLAGRKIRDVDIISRICPENPNNSLLPTHEDEI